VERGVGGVGACDEEEEDFGPRMFGGGEEEEEEDEEQAWEGGCERVGVRTARTMASSLVASTFLPARSPVSLHAATSESS